MRSYKRSDSLSFREAFKKGGPADRIALILSSWFWVGTMPVASGTFGTLAAVAPVVAISLFGAIPSALFLVMLVAVAIWSSDVTRRRLNREDPPEVVIDEAAGFSLSVFLLPVSFSGVFLGFIFFRMFDILKPFPIGLIDRKVKGGFGIVLDDVIAGIFANICVRVILTLFFSP